jgi:hypothetical protein
VKRVLFLQFSNVAAYPPIQHAGNMLLSNGFQVSFLGVKWLDSSGANLCLPVALQSRAKLLECPRPGLSQKIFYLYFVFYALGLAFLSKPKWIYVDDPMAAPIGLILCLMGFQVAYHEHDSPDEKPLSVYDKLLMWCRRQLARRARFNVLPQQVRCNLFKASTGTTRPVLCVMNCPRLNEISPLSRPARQPSQPLGIYYHGSINLTRLPLSLIEAAGSSGLPICLRVVGYETVGSLGASESLRRAAQRFSSTLQLELPGPSSRETLFGQMADMHVGWIAYREEDTDINLRHLAGASNKAFDYLAAGLPLLVNNSPEWHELFVAKGVALPCDLNDNLSQVESIRQQLLWAYEHAQDLAVMGERGRQLDLKEWNYEHQFEPIAAILAQSDARRR